MAYPELIVSECMELGTWLMLADNAPIGFQNLLGSEGVMRISYQSGIDMATNCDGDIMVTRKYAVEHQHAGRVYLDIPEHVLKVVDPVAAKEQVLIHRQLTKELALQVFPEGL